MPVGADFNYWVPKNGGTWVHTASASSIPWWLPHVSLLSLGAPFDNNPNLRLIVTQREVTNNKAVGVWFDTGTQRWYVYNEDGAAMTVGASFNVIGVSPSWGGFTHISATSNTAGNSTMLNNANLNNQPLAQIFVTHEFTGAFHNKALGVWYSSNNQRWNIFNQDGTAMPTGLKFTVMARP
jgi:hypothetical protein